MPLNPLHVCAAARLALGDLREIDRQLSEGRNLDAQWILLVKQCLVAVANLTDLERSIRQIYRTNPEVSAAFKAHKKAFEFAKYVRNIMVGHTNDTLIAKAVEWKPELNWLLLDNDNRATLLVNIFILETALNTYVDENEKHLVLGGDTDLMYPPDWTRFLIWLTDITRGGISFLESLVAAAQALVVPPPKGGPEMMALFAAAGRTTFKRITKTD